MINSLEKLKIVKDRGEAAQIGGASRRRRGAKKVRTIFKIQHKKPLKTFL